jgi:predicted acetyltransferase
LAVAARAGGTIRTGNGSAPPLRVGAALPGDLEPARVLQGQAFGAAAAAEPPRPGDVHELRVAAQNGSLVSCLTLVRTHLWLRGAAVPMGGLRHVATHPDHQNQGYASALIRDTLRDLREDGAPVSVLFPFSFRYYRKFGYELGGNHCQFWCRPNCIPAFAERTFGRPAAPEDLPALTRLHHQRTHAAHCGLPRSPERWSQILANRKVWVHAGEADPTGYLVLEEARDNYGGRLLRLLDAYAAHPEAWRGLLGHLARAAVDSVEWDASAADLTASGLLRSTAPLREGFKPRGIATVRPVFQLRITDLPALLERIAPSLPAGAPRLALRARDEVLPENARPVTLAPAPEGVVARPARPTDPYLEADIRILTQILAGYMAPAEAVSQGLARVSSGAALAAAEHLFPSGDPFIAVLDRF